MRSYPIDSTRVRMISTGKATPVTKWVELSDGSRRPDPQGRQEQDEFGRGLWRVEVIMPSDDADDRDKTEVVEVTITAETAPDPGSFGEMLTFDGLVMSPGYVNRRTGQLTAPRWSATGIKRPARSSGQAAA